MNRDRRRTRLLLVVLLLLSFTLITLDYRSGADSPLAALRDAASAVFGPLEKAASAITRPVGDAISSVGHIGRDRKRADDLQKEVEELRFQIRKGELDQARIEELEKLYSLQQRGRYTTKAAHVVGIGGGLGFEWTATIDVGTRDGIRPDMTVINGDGLVGRIKDAGPNSSTVLLAIDEVSTVFARVAGSGEVGRVDGHGLDPMTMTLLSPNTPLLRGQRLVTVGSVGKKPFVPEVPIGVVTKVRNTPGELTRNAEVHPYVDFTSLDIVGVVVKAPPHVPRGSVLPPSPTPSATPTPTTTPSTSPSSTPTP